MCMSLCVSTTWTISLWAAASLEGFNKTKTHQWQTRLAVILLVSALILYRIPTLWFLYLILPPETSLSFLLTLSLIPFLSNTKTLPFPSLSHAFHTFSLSPSVFIWSSGRWFVSTLVWRINAAVLSVMKPELYWDIGWDITAAFTNSHTSSGLSAKGRAISDGITSFTLSFSEIPSEGIQHGDNGLSQRRKHRLRENPFLSIYCASRWLKNDWMRHEFTWTIDGVAKNKDSSFEGRKSSKVFIIRKE